MAMVLPGAAGLAAAASSMPIMMGASMGSLRSTMNVNAFSGSLSRSLIRSRIVPASPRRAAAP